MHAQISFGVITKTYETDGRESTKINSTSRPHSYIRKRERSEENIYSVYMLCCSNGRAGYGDTSIKSFRTDRLLNLFD